MQHDNSLPKPKLTPTNSTAFKRLTKELTKTVIVCCISSKTTKENLAELCNYYIRLSQWNRLDDIINECFDRMASAAIQLKFWNSKIFENFEMFCDEWIISQ